MSYPIAPEPEEEAKAASQPEAGEQGRPDELPLAPQEIERRSKLLADIAGRIVLLRAAWANTLAFEVQREAETWLAKLQQIATTLPREAAELALGKHSGFLTQAVQTISRPQIPESVQQRIMPPSMPSGKYTDTLSELYWLRFAPPSRPREPEQPHLDPILGSGVSG